MKSLAQCYFQKLVVLREGTFLQRFIGTNPNQLYWYVSCFEQPYKQSNLILHLTEVWKSNGLWNLIDQEKTVFLNNTSGNYLGRKNKLQNVDTKYNYLYKNLWMKKEVDNEDGFKLVHLESKKFLTATLNGLTLEQGM